MSGPEYETIVIGVRLDSPLRAAVELRAGDMARVPRTIARDLQRYYALIESELRALNLRLEQARFLYRTLRRIEMDTRAAIPDYTTLLRSIENAILWLPFDRRMEVAGVADRIRALGPGGMIALLDGLERVRESLDDAAAEPSDLELDAQLIACAIVRRTEPSSLPAIDFSPSVPPKPSGR